MKTSGYELLYIIPAILPTDETEKIKTTVAELLKKENAEILRHELLYERRLAYSIKQCDSGKYLICYFRVSSDALPSIKHALRLLTSLLRHTIVAHDSVETVMNIFFNYFEALKEKRRSGIARARDHRAPYHMPLSEHASQPYRIQKDKQAQEAPTPIAPEKIEEKPAETITEKIEETPIPVKEPSEEITQSHEIPKKKRSLAELDQKLDKLLREEIEL